MKVLILHLSDLHINSYDQINPYKIEKLVESLRILDNFEECLIICSGDIANKGLENDYKTSSYFFGNLINQLKLKLLNRYITLLIVPGNHDANFDNIQRNCDDILDYYSSHTIEQHINEEINMFKAFYKYSSSKTDSPFNYNKIIDVKTIDFAGYVIQLNLINSALFSTLKHNDKELHYFPDAYLGLLQKKEYANLVITVMHHSPENFNWNSKSNLDKFLSENTSILLLGHDHMPSNKDVYINSQKNIAIFAGGIFNISNLSEESEFNAIIIDTSLNKMNSYSFTWNKREHIFNHKKQFIDKSFIHYSLIPPKDSYIKELKTDEKHQISDDFTQYYVFPYLTEINKKDYSETIEINDEQTFINELYDKKRIIIVGEENSGKTALLKYLFLVLSTKKIPIFFTIDDIRDKDIDKIVEPLFKEQYNDNYEKFMQISKLNKVAIVDDFDKVKKEHKNRFINKLKDKFEYILFSSKKEIDFNIVDNIQNQMDVENEIISYKINDFYLEKRTHLIENICNVKNTLNQSKINKIKNKINTYIQNEIKIFELNPDFIIQYTLFFIDDNTDNYIRNDAAFNKVFETNISNAIINNANNYLVDKLFIILEEVAYFIHFNKKYPLSIQDFENIVSHYNSEYSENVNAKQAQDILCNAKIIKQLDNSFSLKFCNTNYLAYFIAKSLKRKYNDTHSSEDLEKVLKNIGFDINAHIMLFYSYIDSNQNVVMQIYNNAQNHIESWKEFSIKDCSLKFLNKTNCIPEITAPTQQDKKKIDKINNDNEKEIKNTQKIECYDIYDYDEKEIDDYSYQIISALKYTEFIAKALPGLGYMLKKDNKIKLINAIHSYPNKIIYKLLEPLDENFDELIKILKEFADEKNLTIDNDKKIPIEETHIEKMLINHSIVLILSIYNNFAHILSDQYSIQLLEGYENSINNKIFNIMATENNGNTERLVKKVDELIPETDDSIINNMLTQIIKKHLIYNENIPYNIYQSIIDKYFGSMENMKKRALKINRFKKTKK